MQIQNQIAVISGGASGMGAATARYLAQAGAKVRFSIVIWLLPNNWQMN